jgi:hypothetical protein
MSTSSLSRRIALPLTLMVIALVAGSFISTPQAIPSPSHLLADAPHGPALLSDSRLNSVWRDGAKRGQLVFDRSAGEPVLVLNKAPFLRGEIRMDIETTSRMFNFSSAARRMDLKLGPEGKYRLLLDGREGKEAIKLDNDDLKFQKSQWVELLRDESSSTFQIYFDQGRDVTITFKLPRDQPLR